MSGRSPRPAGGGPHGHLGGLYSDLYLFLLKCVQFCWFSEVFSTFMVAQMSRVRARARRARPVTARSVRKRGGRVAGRSGDPESEISFWRPPSAPLAELPGARPVEILLER